MTVITSTSPSGEVEERKTEGVLGIDINEKSIDLA